ncbi:hypothetical protein JT359_08005 [Candidatus Poribacteria bacterium]|nr:hypothetical protein [Candidatus Poribacteria bacterium]
MKNRFSYTNSFALIITFLIALISIQFTAQAQISGESTLDPVPQKQEIGDKGIQQDSVLNLIPDTSLGVIYCPSLKELDDSINNAALQLVPQIGVSPEILSMILAESFGAGFTSLSELEEIGLDIEKDFAVFFNSLDPFFISAAVHLTDPDAMIEVITAEADGGEPIDYNGVSYWTTPDESGSFLILDDILVFSQLSEVCETVIDISKGSLPTIVNHPNYTSFIGQIIEGMDQLFVYFYLEPIIEQFVELIDMELESFIDSVESDPASAESGIVIEQSINQFMRFIKSANAFMATLQIDGTDVELSPFLKFKPESNIQEVLKKFTPNELTLFNDLPNNTVINGSFQGDSKFLTEFSLYWMIMITDEVAKTDPEVSAHMEQVAQQIESFNKATKEEWSFSMNINESIIPDFISIVGLNDQDVVKTYLKDHFIKNLEKNAEIMDNAMGGTTSSSIIYEGTYEGTPIVHNGVEINSIIFPNFGSAFVDIPPEIHPLLPQEWQIAYAISDGMLYFAGGSTDQIKDALDIKAGLVENIGENLSYQNLIEKLGTDNNLLVGLSPINAIKKVLDLVAKNNPNIGAEVTMVSGMLMNMPEAYSIGVSAKVEDNGIGGTLLITLGDFQQIIQTFMMINQM